MINVIIEKKLSPFLISRGFKKVKKEAALIWRFENDDLIRKQIIEVSQSARNKNFIRLNARVEGDIHNNEDIDFQKFENKEQLESIVADFILKLENDILKKINGMAAIPYYKPEKVIGEDIFENYRDYAKKIHTLIAVDETNDSIENILMKFQNYLYDKKNQDLIPNETDIKIVCSYIIEALSEEFSLNVTCDPGGRGPKLERRQDDIFYFPLSIVTMYWNEISTDKEYLVYFYKKVKGEVYPYNMSSINFNPEK